MLSLDLSSPTSSTLVVRWMGGNYSGTSPYTNVGDLSDCCGLGTIEVDFIGNIRATNRNNFVVIPEPGTANLIVLCGSFFAALRAYSKGKKRARQGEAESEGAKTTHDGC